jgi:hypothetical protein
MVEKELDLLIERRSGKETDPDEQEELWKAGVVAHNARVQEEHRLAWCEYHQGQARRLRENLEALIAEHEAKAMKLANLEGEA